MAGFADMTKRIKGLRQIVNEIAPAVAVRVETAVREQIAQAVDPAESAWAPRAATTIERHGGSAQPLARYGRHVKTEAARGKIKITIDDKVARFHHKGTSNMPARPLLPDGRLPTAWQQAIEVEFQAEVLKRFTGRGDGAR